MRMDIACPAELLRFEQASFGDGRRQAYLTFLNESEGVITGIAGEVLFEDASGAEVGRRKISFSRLRAGPGETFVCHLALDDCPMFEGLRVSLGRVTFAQGEAFTPRARRVVDVTPAPAEGPERVALVAVAGRDAVCYPQVRGGLWVCVCGRFNRARWPLCRRCGRDRDGVLSGLTREKVALAYGEHKALREREAAPAPPRAQAKRGRGVPWRRGLFLALGGAALALCIWGAARLLFPKPAPENGAPAVYVDYLEAL